MSGKRKSSERSFPGLTFSCPQCGNRVRIPVIWALGVESVFICPKCGNRFKTGFKMGAVWFASALTVAVVTVNLAVYIFSSYITPAIALFILPLWLFYGFLLRRWWLLHRARRNLRKDNQ